MDKQFKSLHSTRTYFSDTDIYVRLLFNTILVELTESFPFIQPISQYINWSMINS